MNASDYKWWGAKDIPGQGLDDSTMAPGERLSDYQDRRKHHER